ncbi:hypothetical protein IMCC20628_03690 [Hoeflea sp. IMCC20628]|uniref:cellulose biosynthesis protein BcsN n=1 Tax=Hoeflea sp. IMCC20628 TaxID=1620421 RepID=UPI00063AEBA2|nr:cellulose biosynthesis protein BcsN [Hoeflea sp. IMCC20628]AKI02374.1 hypothetical protein IMCC20628_03690 [Hoeflea sp. IMCC20628]
MKLHIMAMMALALTASGCATGDDPLMVTGAIKPVAPTLIADVSPDYAAAYLPQVAGRVEAVRQSSKTDQIFQSVLYPNPGYGDGENELSVDIAPPSKGTSYFQAPTQGQVTREMRAALPGVKMQVSTAVGQNLHGPFGYAIGQRASGGSCIFAWQTAEDISRADQTGFGRFTRARYAAKVRLRYCHPSMSEGGLVSLMSGLRIKEVSGSTIEMLRFAEGSGVAARATYATETVQARPVVEPAKVAVTASRKKDPDDVAMPVRNAPRVLKPGELAGYAQAQAKATVLVANTAPEATAIYKAPAIPLPGDLNR